MIYDITLKIGYDYPAAVKDARHILRVRLIDPPADASQDKPVPRDPATGQTVLKQTLTILPKPDEMASDRDFFGNPIDHLLLHRPHDRLSVEMRARVEVAPVPADLENTPSLDDIRDAALATRDAGPRSPTHFLGDSRLVERSRMASAYLKTTLGERSASAAGFGEQILHLTKSIKADFTYAPGTTTIDTPIDEVMKKRRGVCQDFAHVFIGGLRAMGVPAAYVSGFLRTDPPPGRPRLEGADAMHAWVAVWLGEAAGWVGFDPTNAIATGPDHIVVALGRDYADVAPIGGVVVTSGPQKTQHSVDVVPVPAVAAAPAAAAAPPVTE